MAQVVLTAMPFKKRLELSALRKYFELVLVNVLMHVPVSVNLCVEKEVPYVHGCVHVREHDPGP